METKITLGWTPTYLSPTHSTSPPGGGEQDHFSHQRHLLPANREEKVAQEASLVRTEYMVTSSERFQDSQRSACPIISS